MAAQRQGGVRQLLATRGDLEDDRIPPLARDVLQVLAAQRRDLAGRIAELRRRLVALTRSDATCKSLVDVPGSAR